MNLTLIEIQTISELADFLYPFLPGKPHPFADQSISFAGIAIDLGLERFWTGGSKRHAIAALLEGTLSQARSKFCPLMIQIVTRGLKYRGKSNPITREEIEQLNELIKKLGFKIPELWDSDFLWGVTGNKTRKRQGCYSQNGNSEKHFTTTFKRSSEFREVSATRKGLRF